MLKSPSSLIFWPKKTRLRLRPVQTFPKTEQRISDLEFPCVQCPVDEFVSNAANSDLDFIHDHNSAVRIFHEELST